jgi:hypothetical protein
LKRQAPLIIALVANALLLAMVGFVRSDTNQTIRVIAAQRDTVLRQLQLTRNELTKAGDSVPRIRIVNSLGDTTTLSELVRNGGVRYVYFYRDDCPACGVLEPHLNAIPQPRKDSMVFIAYHAAMNLPAADKPRHWSWIRGSDVRRHIRGIPTLFTVRDNGIVESVAHSALEDVSAVLDLYGMVSKQAVDSSKRAVEASVAARQASALPPAR